MIGALILLASIGAADCAEAMARLDVHCGATEDTGAACEAGLDADLREQLTAAIEADPLVLAAPSLHSGDDEMPTSSFRSAAQGACAAYTALPTRSGFDAAGVAAQVLKDPRLQVEAPAESMIERVLRYALSALGALLTSPSARGYASLIRAVFLVSVTLLVVLAMTHVVRATRSGRRRTRRSRLQRDVEARARRTLADARALLGASHVRGALRVGVEVLADVLAEVRVVRDARTRTPTELIAAPGLQALGGDVQTSAHRALDLYQHAIFARRPVSVEQAEGFLGAVSVLVDTLRRGGGR